MFRDTPSRPETLGLILAGGRVDELTALTVYRPKSAMPFGGSYRVIDCALTNMASSGIHRIGILSQYRPLSLMDHVRDGTYWDLRGYNKGVSFLPPHTGETDSDWYKGTADAIFQNIDFIEHHRCPNTLIVSGDHIYRMNYNELFSIHAQTDSDLTMAVTPVPLTTARRYGLAVVGKHNRVEDYHEKPVSPDSNLASMTVYLFKTNVLLKELKRNAKTGKTFQIYDEIIPGLVTKGRVAACVHGGYWSYSRSLKDYHQANMDCLGSNPGIDLSQWKLYTNYDIGRIGDHPPVRTGSNALIENAIISPGCVVRGTVKNSVLSPLVTVHESGEVVDSVIMEGVSIGKESMVHSSIIDKYVTIGDRVRIGCRIDGSATPVANRTVPDLLHCGLTVIGKQAFISDTMTIGKNVIVYPEARPGTYGGLHVQDGMTIYAEE